MNEVCYAVPEMHSRNFIMIPVAVLATIASIGLALVPCSLHAGAGVVPESIPATLAKKGENLSAMKAVMNVTSSYNAGKDQQEVKGFLLYRRPNDFRFQGLAPGGTSLFELIVKADQFELFIPQEGKLLKGNRQCFAKRFPDIAEIEGLIPLILLQWKNVRFDKLLSVDSEKIMIRVMSGNHSFGATLDAKELLLRRLERLTPDGDVDLTASFGDFKTGDYGWLPRHFDVRSPQGQWRSMIKINTIEPNPFLVEKNFQLEPMFTPKVEQCK